MARKAEDLTNREFNEWLVLRPHDHKEHGHARYWWCRCSCGHEQPVRADTLKRNVSTSCGHTHPCRTFGEGHMGWKGCGQLPHTFWSRIKKSADTRHIPFDITIEDAWEMFVKQDGKCALTGQPIEFGHKGKPTTASLDRKDSARGYTSDNIQWVHKRINIMKGDMTDEEFVDFCRMVVDYTTAA